MVHITQEQWVLIRSYLELFLADKPFAINISDYSTERLVKLLKEIEKANNPCLK